MTSETRALAVVTGASTGIGLELAKCFAAEECDLILTARNRDALEKLADELRGKHGIKVEIIIADLSLPESPQKIFTEAKGRGFMVDVLVNNSVAKPMASYRDSVESIDSRCRTLSRTRPVSLISQRPMIHRAMAPMIFHARSVITTRAFWAI